MINIYLVQHNAPPSLEQNGGTAKTQQVTTPASPLSPVNIGDYTPREGGGGGGGELSATEARRMFLQCLAAQSGISRKN